MSHLSHFQLSNPVAIPSLKFSCTCYKATSHPINFLTVATEWPILVSSLKQSIPLVVANAHVAFNRSKSVAQFRTGPELNDKMFIKPFPPFLFNKFCWEKISFFVQILVLLETIPAKCVAIILRRTVEEFRDSLNLEMI